MHIIHMEFSFDLIDLSSYSNDYNDSNDSNNLISNYDHNFTIKTTKTKVSSLPKYDKTTNETYRIKRLYKIDPFLDNKIPSNLCFEFKYKWNPFNGERGELDEIGPLCFNAINLYDYYYINRYKGLWIPPQDGFQGMYGDLVGNGKNVNIKSRGIFPERYLFRLPIIDCYILSTQNLSVVTMGPELTEDEITQIDTIVIKLHPKKSNTRFASLTMLKYYYDRALDITPDQNSDEIKELKLKYNNLSQSEINAKYNRYYVDKLINLKY